MNHILHRVWFRLAALCCLFCALPQIAAAQDETPIIQFKSVAKEVASASSITLFIGGFNTTTDYIDVDCGNGMEERELLPATINTETCEAIGMKLDDIKAAFGTLGIGVVEITTAKSFS